MNPIGTSYLALAGRSVRHFLRSPEISVQTVAFPIIMLLTLLAAFGTAVEAFSGDAYAQKLVPVLIVSGLMFGSVGSALSYFIDLHSGFATRVKSMPTPASAPLVGASLAEVFRAVVTVTVLVSVGYIVGFRFSGGLAGIVGFFALAALAGVSIIWIGLALASVAKSQEALSPPLSALFMSMLFLSDGMVPLKAFPGWTQPIVRINPASSYVGALDALATGNPASQPIFHSILWSLGLIAVFATLAVTKAKRVSR